MRRSTMLWCLFVAVNTTAIYLMDDKHWVAGFILGSIAGILAGFIREIIEWECKQ